jgi:hypothetical protein
MRLRKTPSSDAARDGRPLPRERSLHEPARQELTEAVLAIQDAILALNQSVGLDPLRPQEVSRAVKLNKNLTWKCARVLLADDAFDAIPMLPGPEGIEIYLRGFAAAGAPSDRLESARRALGQFDVVAERHFGGRTELDAALDGLRRDANLEQSRRAAFRANSTIFGVQAAARITLHIVEPPRPATQGPRVGELASSISMVVGLAGVRRLRPIQGLPVFRASLAQSDGPGSIRPLLGPSDEAGGGAEGAGFLLREFSNLPNASLQTTKRDGRISVELLDGPIGRLGEASMYFGTVLEQALCVHRSATDTVAELVTMVSIPAERFVNDIYIHKDVPGAQALEASWHSILAGPLSADEEQRENTRLPIQTRLLSVDAAEAPSMKDIPAFDALRDSAFAARGLRREDFRLFRIALEHPAAPSALLVRWELPEPPRA